MAKTTNYNPARFAVNQEDNASSSYNKMMTEFNNNGRCNNCKYFNFGKMVCTKKNDAGEFIRPNPIANTYTMKTDKGNFINVIRPSDCNDFTIKNVPKVKKSDEE